MRLKDADDILADPYFQDESIPERLIFIEAVENSPTISPDSLVKRGRWLPPAVSKYGCICSVCEIPQEGGRG